MVAEPPVAADVIPFLISEGRAPVAAIRHTKRGAALKLNAIVPKGEMTRGPSDGLAN